MDELGVERRSYLRGQTGEKFEEIVALLPKIPGSLFHVVADWITRISINLVFETNASRGFGSVATRAELKGVGELSDKGGGLTGNAAHSHLHIDDQRLAPRD